MILASGGFTREWQLFHWHREGCLSREIDYLVELNSLILPLEMNSGAASAMNTLHQFMHDMWLHLAHRLDRNLSSLHFMAASTTQDQAVRYTLLNLPLYLCGFLGEMDLGATSQIQ